MQPVIYHIKRSVVRNLRYSYSLLGVGCVGFAVNDFANLLLHADYGPVGEFLMPPGYEAWWHGVSAAILTVLAVAYITQSLRVFRHGSPDQNFLRLDNGGLTYVLWGYRRQWSWRELPSFQLAKSAIYGHRFLKFALPDTPPWSSRLGLWAGIGKSSGNQAARIADLYDLPLDEIVVRLKEYQGVALSG